jgi:hypothetical protein
LSGDKEALSISASINEARAKNNLNWSLSFEKTLLQSARDKFELISPLEFTDLERLQQDRNRCAHPSLAVDGEPFRPPAELARLHIRSAVMHFLQHPPVQGKAALERIVSEVESPYFPTDGDKAIIAFSSGPLKRPRKSLVSNFIVVLIKKSFTRDAEWKLRMRVFSALKATCTLHPAVFQETLKAKLSTLIRNQEDEVMTYVLQSTMKIPGAWDCLEADVYQRFKMYVENMPDDDLDTLEDLIDFDPLKKNARRRISLASISALQKALWFIPPREVIERFVDSYCSSKNFDGANNVGAELRSNASLLTLEDINKIVVEAGKNDQVASSYSFPTLLTSIVRAGKISQDNLEEALKANMLDIHVPIAS